MPPSQSGRPVDPATVVPDTIYSHQDHIDQVARRRAEASAPASLYDVDQLSEDEASHEFVRRLAYKVVRPADEAFERAGGGTRHWVRDHFLPALAAEGLKIVPIEEAERGR